ncbi:MAG: dethiobiotin synthase [Gammaproteobacteria bacterium]|nr:MAG: dethiobiotin synthase [Gammaproteobacteria bacterium]
MKGLFIAGTDTGCGKTRVACTLAEALRRQGLAIAPFKPVAAGAIATPAGLRNEDALALIEACGGHWAYDAVNPVCLRAPISPHLAAREAGVAIDVDELAGRARRLAEVADLVLAEGAGGWMAPISDRLTMEDLALALDLPVLLVVGLRLGCLNHALLTAARMQACGVRAVGWIGSVIDPAMQGLEENIATLQERLSLPMLGVLPHGDPGRAVMAWSVRLDELLSRLAPEPRWSGWNP